MAAGACGHGAGGDDEAGATPAVVGARTAVATRRPFTQVVGAIGDVVARPGHIAALGAPGPSRITRVLVVTGQRVARGAPLVELDRAPFDAAARSAAASLEEARHGYERTRALVGAGILARKELDQAATQLAQAEAANVAARRAQSLATLRSPIAGVVTSLDAVLGAPADVGRPLVEVADPAALDLVFTVSPGDAARIHPGAPVRLTAGQQGSGEPLGTGVVIDVGATVDSASRGVLVRARAAHPTRPLRIGETVFGRITAGVHPDAVTVPTEALVPEGEGFRVFVVDRAHVAHATPVSVGARGDSLAEITRGLSGGETVVTYGAYGVEDGARIVPPATGAAPASASGDSAPGGERP